MISDIKLGLLKIVFFLLLDQIALSEFHIFKRKCE